MENIWLWSLDVVGSGHESKSLQTGQNYQVFSFKVNIYQDVAVKFGCAWVWSRGQVTANWTKPLSVLSFKINKYNLKKYTNTF